MVEDVGGDGGGCGGGDRVVDGGGCGGRRDGNGGGGGGSGGSDGGDGSAGDGSAASHTNRGVDARSSAAAAYPREQTSLGLRSVSPLLSSSGTMLWLACRWLSILQYALRRALWRFPSTLPAHFTLCLLSVSCPGWICVSLLWDLHRPSCVHPHRVRERGTHRSALVGVPECQSLVGRLCFAFLSIKLCTKVRRPTSLRSVPNLS